MPYSNGIILFKYVFQPSLVIVSSWKLWYIVLNLPCDHMVKGPVTQWLHAISSFPPNLVYISFLKIWHNNMENREYKVRQFKKWDRKQLKQSYYRVWQKFITKCVRYYKMCQVLQSVIDYYYKVCQILQNACNYSDFTK